MTYVTEPLRQDFVCSEQTDGVPIMEKRKNLTQQRNEGEGNRTATRKYNEAQQRFIKSGQVGQKAHEAERDLGDEAIRRELEHAEAVGKSHAAGEDPEVKRSYKKD
jgi:hypothetical protein